MIDDPEPVSINVGELIPFDEVNTEECCPWTFLAFAKKRVDHSGLPADREAKFYLAAIQSRGIQIGIWMNPPSPNTAYAAVQIEDRDRLHQVIDDLAVSGHFDDGFAQRLSERLCMDERGE